MNLENYKAIMVADIVDMKKDNFPVFSTNNLEKASKICEAYNKQATIAKSESIFFIRYHTCWMKKKIIETIDI